MTHTLINLYFYRVNSSRNECTKGPTINDLGGEEILDINLFFPCESLFEYFVPYLNKYQIISVHHFNGSLGLIGYHSDLKYNL